MITQKNNCTVGAMQFIKKIFNYLDYFWQFHFAKNYIYITGYLEFWQEKKTYLRTCQLCNKTKKTHNGLPFANVFECFGCFKKSEKFRKKWLKYQKNYEQKWGLKI